MFEHLRVTIAFLSGVGAGLIAGVFFAFSTFVMKSLVRLPPAQGIAAMQSINIAVLNPWFLSVFLGTAATCVLAVLLGCLRPHESGAVQLVTGGILYLVGTFLVTRIWNVPLNDNLATVDPRSGNGSARWTHYVATWTRWNHVRTIAALAASVVFVLALQR